MAELYDDCHAAGGMSRYAYEDDPKRLAFTAARYKHTAKLLEGKRNVLEVGCSDGFFSRIVRQHVGSLTAIDTDEKSIAEAVENARGSRWDITFQCVILSEYCKSGPGGWFDAVYCLDVLEHVLPDDRFLSCLSAFAPVAVIGTPSKESQSYASRLSRAGHMNCYSGDDLRKRLLHYWNHVFLLTMHDETLGTSFAPMAHYLLALCVRDEA